MSLFSAYTTNTSKHLCQIVAFPWLNALFNINFWLLDKQKIILRKVPRWEFWSWGWRKGCLRLNTVVQQIQLKHQQTNKYCQRHWRHKQQVGPGTIYRPRTGTVSQDLICLAAVAYFKMKMPQSHQNSLLQSGQITWGDGLICFEFVPLQLHIERTKMLLWAIRSDR